MQEEQKQREYTYFVAFVCFNNDREVTQIGSGTVDMNRPIDSAEAVKGLQEAFSEYDLDGTGGCEDIMLLNWKLLGGD